MNISDEILSAFLDAELDPEAMDAVRDALVEDEAIADRLAELAEVDARVVEAYSTIDERPVPAAITALLQGKREEQKVVSLSAWKRLRQGVAKPQGLLAAAASLVVMSGALLVGLQGSSEQSALVAALESSPSGVEQPLGDEQRFLGRLTFRNSDQDYCRQYALINADEQREYIACRQAGEWQTVAESDASAVTEYQPASGGSALDAVLDGMIDGDLIGPEQEQRLLNSDWSF